MRVKLTSGGSDSGARPILERVGAVVEKREGLGWEVKAGTRKAGRLPLCGLEVLSMCCKALEGRWEHLDAAIDAERCVGCRKRMPIRSESNLEYARHPRDHVLTHPVRGVQSSAC